MVSNILDSPILPVWLEKVRVAEERRVHHGQKAESIWEEEDEGSYGEVSTKGDEARSLQWNSTGSSSRLRWGTGLGKGVSKKGAVLGRQTEVAVPLLFLALSLSA